MNKQRLKMENRDSLRIRNGQAFCLEIIKNNWTLDHFKTGSLV